MCVVIERLLQEEFKIVGGRRDLKLPSFARKIDNRTLSPQAALIFLRVAHLENETATITFMPTCAHTDHSCEWLEFSKWWNEAVYVEGAGGKTSLVPLDEKEQVPFKKRKRVSRMIFIQRTRREIGAHYDEAKSEAWDYFSSWNHEMAIRVGFESGNVWNAEEHPDHVSYKNKVSDAAIRCISEEVAVGVERWLTEHAPKGELEVRP